MTKGMHVSYEPYLKTLTKFQEVSSYTLLDVEGDGFKHLFVMMNATVLK